MEWKVWEVGRKDGLEDKRMKKCLGMIVAGILLACFMLGCGRKDYNAMSEKHAATKTYRDGVWEVRYNSIIDQYAGEIVGKTLYLSVDVHQDMTEEDMLDIMDYYEFRWNARWDNNNHYIGERESDFTCYAVFYRGGTDEEVRRSKYFNGKEVEIPEEEQSYFPKPDMHSSMDEMGGNGVNGLLP